MNTLTDIQAAYLAGLMDGEGSIGIFRLIKNYETIYYQPFVKITNTNLSLVDWCKTTTNIGIISNKHNKGNRKVSYNWVLRHNEIIEFLPRIKHYLIIKQYQAELMLEYLNECKVKPRIEISNKIKTKRAVIYEILANLNKKGL